MIQDRAFFENRGITLSIGQSGKIRFQCPAGSMSSELRAALVENRDSLLVELWQGGGVLSPKSVTGDVGLVTDQTHDSVECDGCDGFLNTIRIENKDTMKRAETHAKNIYIKELRIPQNPSNPSHIETNQAVNPSLNQQQPITTRHTKPNPTTDGPSAPGIDHVPPAPKPKQEPVKCFCCKGTDFWLSVYGVRICRLCHPPGSPELEAKTTTTQTMKKELIK